MLKSRGVRIIPIHYNHRAEPTTGADVHSAPSTSTPTNTVAGLAVRDTDRLRPAAPFIVVPPGCCQGLMAAPRGPRQKLIQQKTIKKIKKGMPRPRDKPNMQPRLQCPESGGGRAVPLKTSGSTTGRKTTIFDLSGLYFACKLKQQCASETTDGHRRAPKPPPKCTARFTGGSPRGRAFESRDAATLFKSSAFQYSLN